VVAFLKKRPSRGRRSAKDFYNLYTGFFSVPREQKFFAELFYKKATACLGNIHAG
jgi:hypothetical protein